MPDTETSTPTNTESITVDREKVLEVLAMVRPYLNADGGDVELVEITEDGVVRLKLQGACGTCPSSTYTLKMGIEEQLRQFVPGLKCVEQVI